MYRFLKIVLVLLILFIAAAVAVPFLVPVETIKNEALAQIKAHTGREVTMGKASFTLFPTLGLDAEDVEIGNPDWIQGGKLAEIKTLKIGIALMPLLHGEYRLKNFTLVEPVITLIKYQHRANWDFSKRTPLVAGVAQPAPHTSAHSTQASPNGAIPDLHLENIAITKGTLTYKDETSAKTEVVTDIDFNLEAPDLDTKADITFSATYGGKKADITLAFKKPLGYSNGGTTGVSLKAVYGPLDFTWEGSATLGRNGVPVIDGKINVPSLNTADLSQKDSAEATHSGGSASKGASAPRAEGASHWSDAPINLNGLKSANGDLTVSIGKLTLPKTTLENIVAHIHLAGGALGLQIDPLNAYGGTINLALAANTAGAVNIAFAAAHAEAEPLLHDFAGYDRLSGTINLQTKIAGVGGSQRAIINSLSGNGSVGFKDGKLKGVNIGAMLRKLAGGGTSEDESTDFSDLSGTYTIAKGIVTTNDLKLASPFLRMTGTGNADLPHWQEHFVLKPTLVASAKGQGGGNTAGITVPVNVDGPLDHPHYQPDFAAALKDNLTNPAALKQDVQDLLKDGKINSDTLRGLLR